MMVFDRRSAVAALANQSFDVVVIGGGITGAGVALDAASRGLRTALVERDDFSSGTSSRSSKLVHGGLRYLQQRDVRLVYEALAERQRLLQNASHLVHELSFLIPMFREGGLVPKQVARAIGGAMWGYDLTGGLRIGKRHRKLTATESADLMPRLRHDQVAWSYLYWDAQADDSRLTMAILRTAALDFGAVVANRVEVSGISTRAATEQVEGVRVQTPGGEEFVIEARTVVNATGVWADEVANMDRSAKAVSLSPAKGVHLAFPSHLFENQVAAVVPVSDDGRTIFVVPWGGQTYVGTTDTAYDGDRRNPQTTSEDIEYVLGAVTRSTTAAVDESAITGTWAGLRPLVSNASSARTADLSRRHAISCSPAGVVTITGGKLTTYRQMASDAVDEVVGYLNPAPALRSCRTAKLSLRGSDGHDHLSSSRAPVSSETMAHLVDRYGSETGTLTAIIDADPGLVTPMVEGLPYLRAEAVFAARYEMATTLDDIVTRRTRARLRHAPATARAAASIAAVVAPELGWSAAESARQVSEVHRLCAEDMSGTTSPATTQ